MMVSNISPWLVSRESSHCWPGCERVFVLLIVCVKKRERDEATFAPSQTHGDLLIAALPRLKVVN